MPRSIAACGGFQGRVRLGIGGVQGFEKAISVPIRQFRKFVFPQHLPGFANDRREREFMERLAESGGGLFDRLLQLARRANVDSGITTSRCHETSLFMRESR